MGTRPGQIDPGIVLYLITEKCMQPAAIENLLYRESGLKGLSGVSNDMRELEASNTHGAGWRSITLYWHAGRGARRTRRFRFHSRDR